MTICIHMPHMPRSLLQNDRTHAGSVVDNPGRNKAATATGSRWRWRGTLLVFRPICKRHLVRNGRDCGILWGSDPLEPVSSKRKNFAILTFLSCPKTLISRSFLSNASMILLRQGNVSHSQEMINTLCSSVLASTLSTGPIRSC